MTSATNQSGCFVDKILLLQEVHREVEEPELPSAHPTGSDLSVFP